MLRAAGDAAVGAPEGEAPAVEVQDLVVHRLPQDLGVLGHGEVVTIVVAVEVADRRVDRPERVGDLAFETQVGVAVEVRDPVAEIEHQVRPGVGDEAGELRHQGQRGVAALGRRGCTVMDVGNDGDAQGHAGSLVVQ